VRGTSLDSHARRQPHRLRRARWKSWPLEADGVRGYPTTFRARITPPRCTRSSRARSHGYASWPRRRVQNVGKTGLRVPEGPIRAGQLMFHPRDMDAATRKVSTRSTRATSSRLRQGDQNQDRRGERRSPQHAVSKSLRNPPEKWHGLVDVETRYRSATWTDDQSGTRQVFLTRTRVITRCAATWIARASSRSKRRCCSRSPAAARPPFAPSRTRSTPGCTCALRSSCT